VSWSDYGRRATLTRQPRYASIGAVLMTEKIADGIRDGAGFWKHGHTYQAHPLACAASLAVQKVIMRDNLLEKCREQGAYLREFNSTSVSGVH
jgi:adenosylmethionine-8-amino-7-oxononanoate aminotransferase